MTAIGSITIDCGSGELDNGETLRDLFVGDSVELRPDTGHEGLWIAAKYHADGDWAGHITLQHAEYVDCAGTENACKFAGHQHAHPVDLDGTVRPHPTSGPHAA